MMDTSLTPPWRDERPRGYSDSFASCAECLSAAIGGAIAGRWDVRVAVERSGRGARCRRCHALATYLVTAPFGGRP